MYPEDLNERVAKALELAVSGMNDGGHHKMWVIDQMVRALTGCPIIELNKLDYKDDPFTYKTLGKSEEYKQWIAKIQAGEDGPNTYEWEIGVAP
jgi:hypothetical protein